mgnify:CR=1 FL=1
MFLMFCLECAKIAKYASKVISLRFRKQIEDH